MENESLKSMHKVDEIEGQASVYVTDSVFSTIIGLAVVIYCLSAYIMSF